MIEVRIPKEIRTYKEKLFLGLNVRQTVCSVLALAINVPLYIFARPYIGDQIASWVIIFTAGPLFLVGFFNYNGMPFEQFLVCIMKFMFLTPQKRKYKVENLYAILLEMYEKEKEFEAKGHINFIHRMFNKKKQIGGGEGIEHS
ncbi:MAG: PrgI family protein [Peptococcia bacterium]